MFKALFFFFKKETNFLRDSRDPHTIQPVISWNVTRVLNFAFTCIMVEALSDLQVFIGHGMKGAIEYIYIYKGEIFSRYPSGIQDISPG